VVNLFLIRVFDIIISCLLIILTSPLLFFLFIVVFLEDFGNPLFLQRRVGLNHKEFTIYKFRSMKISKEDGLWATKSDSRITKIGKLLRATHLDELPQLFNILLGNMSFVGPRPFRKKIINMILKIEPNFSKRVDVKPGLTGWSQLFSDKGETLEDHAKKLKYDLKYIEETLTITTYFYLILKTMVKVFTQLSH